MASEDAGARRVLAPLLSPDCLLGGLVVDADSFGQLADACGLRAPEVALEPSVDQPGVEAVAIAPSGMAQPRADDGIIDQLSEGLGSLALRCHGERNSRIQPRNKESALDCSPEIAEDSRSKERLQPPIFSRASGWRQTTT